MRTVSVIIEGTTPILFNNPAGMAQRTEGKKPAIPTPEDEALKSCYWLDEKRSAIAFPADNIKNAMISVAPQYKGAGKLRLTPFVAGSIYLEPPLLSFGTKAYEIDTRRAVVQRQGILRSRARLGKDWRLSFDMNVDDDFPVRDLEILKVILEETGRRVGIGDFRPAKKGWFGKFKVIDWKEKNNGTNGRK